MDEKRPTRRRLLRAAGVASAGGLGGLAGCLDALGNVGGGDYVCTQLDDESTERVGADGTPVPLSFERPEVLERTESNAGSSGGGRVEFTREWTQQSTRQEGLLQNELQLSVVYGPGGPVREPRYVFPDFRTVTVVGKRSFEGTPVGAVELEGRNRESWLEVRLPRTRDGQRVYDEFGVEATAAVMGREEEVAAALSDDSDQTCGDALRAVTTAVVDSVPELSPPETDTSLSLSPSSASVQSGGTAEFTLQVEGVDWVDLVVGDRQSEYSFIGALEVSDGPTPVTVEESGGSGVVSVPEDTTLNVVRSSGELVAGSYPVRALAPGTDGLVEATATLSVE